MTIEPEFVGIWIKNSFESQDTFGKYLRYLHHLHRREIELRIKAKMVEVPLIGGDNTSTSKQILPPQYIRSTFKLPIVEIVEMSEIFFVG
jgi:hypothetical protein